MDEEVDDYVERIGGRKRGCSDFIDDAAEDNEYYEEEDVGRGRKHRKRGSEFFDLEARVDNEEEEKDDEEGEDDFINDVGADLPDESGGRRAHYQLNMMPEDQEDVEEMERQVYERYAKSSHIEYGDDATEIEQQALLPSVKDPKLWMVKCAIGRERETTICLMKKSIDRPDLQIRSVVALDYLKNYIFVEADKEAHVKEACKGLHIIYSSAKVMLVPIKEMTAVLSIESKTIELSRDTWVRMKLGVYKGDLAKVVDVDNVRQKETVKLIQRKKRHFSIGDAVVVVHGDLKNLKGCVEKIEDETVNIKPEMAGLPKTLSFNDKELCKLFKLGDYVKVVSGVHEGATGMVVKVDAHVLIIASDTTKEDICVFADNVVKSTEVTSRLRKMGDYELQDLVLLYNMSFGVIIRVESEAFQVLKGVPDRPEVVLVKLGEIKSNLKKRANAQDNGKNIVSVMDVVRVLEGPCKGKQGPVQHIHRGILFIHDRHHLEHEGFICVKAQSCIILGGNNDRWVGDKFDARFALRPSSTLVQSSRRPPKGPTDYGGRINRGARGNDSFVGRTIKIRSEPFKGYRGRVVEVTGAFVRIELDSQMKIVAVKREDISYTSGSATPFREPTRFGFGSETPMHPSRTPLHPYQASMRDPGATPIHEGMRTPMHNQAWAPMSPPRDHWVPGSWGSSSLY